MTGTLTDFKGFDEDTVSLGLGLYPRFGTKWEWKSYRAARGFALRTWGYPMAVGSSVFRTSDIVPIIENNNVDSPNHLEMVLHENIPDKPYMECLDSRRVINNSANQVQREFRNSNLGISLDELEDRFIDGQRISLKDIVEKTKGARSFRVREAYVYE